MKDDDDESSMSIEQFPSYKNEKFDVLKHKRSLKSESKWLNLEKSESS